MVNRPEKKDEPVTATPLEIGIAAGILLGIIVFAFIGLIATLEACVASCG